MNLGTTRHEVASHESQGSHQNRGAPTRSRKDGEASPVLVESIASVADGRGAHAVIQYTEHEVRQRAYELYEARQGENGDADADWYAAEEELRSVSGP